MLKEDLLYLLEQQKGRLVSGSALAETLGVSRAAIWKAIRTLRQEGREILSFPRSGYMLLETDDALLEKRIAQSLTTTFIGRQIRLLSVISSTNQYLKELDPADTPNGFTVVADGQTSGRGRRGRSFVSRQGEGIYLSILLKLGTQLSGSRLLTVCAAVAVSRAIEHVCGVRADIKWVNDIFCNGKKICGILTEAVVSGELQELSTVIVGIGINTGTVAPEVADIATSIQETSGMRGVRNRLIAEVLNQFESIYTGYVSGGARQDMIAYYSSRLFIIGRRVLVSGVTDSYTAVVAGIDEDCALIVEDDDGSLHYISTGEIKLI